MYGCLIYFAGRYIMRLWCTNKSLIDAVNKSYGSSYLMNQCFDIYYYSSWVKDADLVIYDS